MTAIYSHLALPELLTGGHGQPGNPSRLKTFRRTPLSFNDHFPRRRLQNRTFVDTGALVNGCLAAALACRAASGTVEVRSKHIVLLQGFREWWAKVQRMRTRHRPPPGELQTAPQGAERVTYLAVVVNLLLAGVKLAAGIMGNSAALVADAGHSLSDLFSDYVTLWAVKIAKLPPDEDHPYGHGRFEAVGALCVSGLLMAAGGGIALDAVQLLRAFACERCAVSMASPGGLAFIACTLSIVSKELLFRATDAVGQRLNSPVIRANAKHHRSDVWSSVVALVGVVGSWRGITWFDPFAALLVAGMVMNMGLGVALDAVGQLTDTTDEAIVASVRRAAQAVVGTGNVSATRARAMGSHWLIDMEVLPDEYVLTASAADQLAARVRHAVLSEVGDTKECLVHVRTPATPTMGVTDSQVDLVVDLPTPREIDNSVRGALEAMPGIKAVTRTLAHFDANAVSVEVLLEVPSGCTMSEGRQLAQSARGAIFDSQPNLASVQIHLALPNEAA